MIKYKQNYATPQGNSSGSVERAVASDTRGPQFESSHWQTLKLNMFLLLSVGKTKIKKKKPGITQLLDIASNVLKLGHSRPLFLYFCIFFSCHGKAPLCNFTADLIRTADFWYQKRQSCQQSHTTAHQATNVFFKKNEPIPASFHYNFKKTN